MNKIMLLLFITFLPIVSSHGQAITISKLEKRIEELEERVLILENLILNRGTNPLQDDSTYANNLSNWRKIKVGMKDEDIRNILGEPKAITRYSRTFYVWQYESDIGTGYIRFDERGVFSWDEPN